MFDHIFENRNKKLVNLIKLGDCMGRSLRENIELFKISDADNYVSYITEGRKVISGNYSLDDEIELSNLVIEDAEIYNDDDKFDKHVQHKVSGFVRSLYEDKFGDAEVNFGEVLDTWNDRIRFERTQQVLDEKIRRFDESTNIVTTPEFMRFIEIAPQLLDFLKENKDDIIEIPEIRNAVKLSNVVTEAFDLPRLNYETLTEAKSYVLKENTDNSIYEMICKQELIKKDLLESKKQFDESWATHDKVRNLAGLVYEDPSVIAENLADVIEEVPYFAFISKKQISNTVRNSLSLIENQVPLPEKDMQQFVSLIFEMKKEIKQELISILSEKYGVNVQNLKDTPSFKSLINTQVLIFEMLSRLSPKGSIQKDVLKETGQMLKEKSGVQGIDVNDCLKILFEAAGYSDLIEDNDLLNQISLEDALADVEVEKDLSDKMNIDEGEKKGDKSKDKPEDKPDYTTDARKGDKSKTHAGKDFEDDDDDDDDNDDKKSSKKDLKETSDKDNAPITKEEYLDALANLENVLQDIGNSENRKDEDSLQEKWGDKKGDKGAGKHKDEKDYEDEGDRKGDESEEDSDKKDYDDDKDEKADLDKAKQKTEKKDKKYRKGVIDDIAKKAAKIEKKRKGPKELGDGDDEV